MSTRSSGCLTSIFRSCKPKSHRKTVCAKSNISLCNSQESITQNYSLQTSQSLPKIISPAQNFLDANQSISHKPRIVIKKDNKFELQRIEGKSIKNSEIKSPRIFESNESMQEDKNNGSLLSIQTCREIFNSPNDISWKKTFSKINPLPNPFVFDAKLLKPKLAAITPRQLLKGKTIIDENKTERNEQKSKRKIKKAAIKPINTQEISNIYRRRIFIKEKNKDLCKNFGDRDLTSRKHSL
ncbi:unnamed protein product [Blepharisma stoltei]|uniref:Uncharacterized protein n=1 Tax=Blepharisma stoltei TaxID=1481888 RepID=A0AAU9IAI0_9CILI|nr:unnamed protein product [Blepharisma stoltei]